MEPVRTWTCVVPSLPPYERRGFFVKYVVLIIDGASGWPVPVLGGRTSLEAAHIPYLDRLAREGTVGMSYTVPEGMEASSAVACMSVMGFDPTRYYAGRGPIEAMAMGIDLEPGQVALRCNLVNVSDGIMTSYSAGSISSVEAAELVAALQAELGDERLQFHAGVGFRHILTVRGGTDLLATTFTPAHDVSDREVAAFGPMGPGAGLAGSLMERSKAVLAGHRVNQERIARGELPATQIWLFWPGIRPGEMPTFAQVYEGRTAALTSAVDLLRGLALQAGVDVLFLPGITDDVDNDFAGQMAGALRALDDHDVVFVHVEAPDEASHAGDVARKVKAIEQVDALMVAQVVERRQGDGAPGSGGEAPGSGGSPSEAVRDLSLLVLSDHPTPLEVKTHVAEPVPFVMWGPGFTANGARTFSETEARATGLAVAPGHLLLGRLLTGGCDTRADLGPR
jgi:2,3-bisphosphoglycerate-independent phosphoglycerate mutase